MGNWLPDEIVACIMMIPSGSREDFVHELSDLHRGIMAPDNYQESLFSMAPPEHRLLGLKADVYCQCVYIAKRFWLEPHKEYAEMFFLSNLEVIKQRFLVSISATCKHIRYATEDMEWLVQNVREIIPRSWIIGHDWLLANGWSVDGVTVNRSRAKLIGRSPSVYYEKEGRQFRVADHYVKDDKRRDTIWSKGGFTWTRSPRQAIVSRGATPSQVLREVVERSSSQRPLPLCRSRPAIGMDSFRHLAIE